MDITRNDDGSLIVPVEPERVHAADEVDGEVAVPAGPTSRTLRPGEGGYDEALAEWDRQQHPERDEAVSTPTGRQEAMHAVHAVGVDDVAPAEVLGEIDDPEASAEALRHVLVGGVHSVEDFASEVADAEGGDPLPAHQATKVIGEVLAEIDSTS